MFTEDKLAAAQIAQIFGSELLKVQQTATNDQGNVPDIVKIDPKQFLIGRETLNEQKKSREQSIILALQKEAEAAYPLQQQLPSNAPAPLAAAAEPTVITQRFNSPPAGHNLPTFTAEPSHTLERIAISLEKIANAVDRVDLSVRKRKIKRISNSKKDKV